MSMTMSRKQGHVEEIESVYHQCTQGTVTVTLVFLESPLLTDREVF
jgi:hypothetical protein